jgi:hypothetical protein
LVRSQHLAGSAIEYVALELRDDEREARNLSRKVPQFDAPEIRERDFRAAVPFTAPLV